MVAYGILDLIAKPVFCFYHVLQISKLDMSRFTFVRVDPQPLKAGRC